MKKVLFIEDDQLTIEMVVRKFKKEGIELLVARDGESGLEIMKKEKINLVLLLLDLLLPGMSGYDVLEYIRDDPELAKIPVVVFSNLGQKDEKRRAKQLGAKNFIIKAETDLEEVVDIAKKYLN